MVRIILCQKITISLDVGWEVGEKFERKKVRIAEKVELFSAQTFSSNFFLVHIDAEAVVLQKWHTYFKACSKSLRMAEC